MKNDNDRQIYNTGKMILIMKKTVHVPVDWTKEIACASGWILLPQSLNGLLIKLINEIIIIHL